jgi:hypothetical protein
VSAQQRGESEIVVQVSLTAGLRYHDAKAVWDQMKVGDALTLVSRGTNMTQMPYEWSGTAAS